MSLSGRYAWALLAVFIAAAVVRVALLNRSGLWADEIFSLALATGHSLEHPASAARPELGDFVEPDHSVLPEEFRKYLRHETPLAGPSRVVRAVLLSDTSPALYYLLLYYWTLFFGTSDLVLRLFSSICSLACLPFIAGIASRTGGKNAVVPACTLFALSPLSIYYATEGRMYSLLLLCIVMMIWASLVLQERGGSRGIFTLWIGSSFAGFMTHYFFVFPFLAVVAYLIVQPGTLTRARLTTSILLVLVLSFPWYVQLWHNFGNWRITQGWLTLRPGHFNRLIASIDLVSGFFSARAYELWIGRISWQLAALLLFVIVASLGWWRLRGRVFTGPRLLLWLLFGGGCAGPFASDLMQHTYMVAKPRYAVGGLPAAYLLAAVAFACLSRRARIVMLTLIVLAWAPNIWSIYHQGSPWEPMRDIAAAARKTAPSGVILVHSIPSGLLAIARYSKQSLPLASWVQQLGTRRVPESLDTLAAGRTEITFVRVHDAGAPAPEEDWLTANAIAIDRKRLGLSKLFVFRPKQRETF
jgi:4-amino-4-deoxy-L-arabinose transferase-like glycosyltransferase